MKAESATLLGLKSGMDLVCLGGWGMWREEGGDCIVGQGDMVCVLCFVCFWCFFSFSLFFLSPFLFFFGSRISPGQRELLPITYSRILI